MHRLWKSRAKRIAITGGLEAAHLIAALRLMRSARGRGVIFTLHHVRPHEPHAFEPNAHLEITPAFLDAALTRLAHDGYRFVALDKIPALLSGPAGDHPFAAFTLDDGYRNNLVHAYPIFEKHEAPFTVFVAKGLTERTHTIWWETLAAVLRKAEKVHFDFGGGDESITLFTLADQHAAFSRFAAHVHGTDEASAVAKIDALARRHEIDPAELVDDLVMGAAELNLLDASPLASIGAHTVSHRALARLPEAEIREEMALSADHVEAITGKRPETFAFPYGTPEAATRREAAIAAELSFKVAVTTRPGVMRADLPGSTTYLPRLSLNGFYQKPRYVSALASGIPLKLMGR
ncbi:Polysaccharide deacetylase [Rhizobium mongolense subsp. loessense]|uniref:Chitooligosaccharide deacetylase n=1 Tax=Rhizobium mongolense subsp. loessense TaxID=158890 RepID=A0A1G4PHN6_9HYPH|nr:polysaccharide deacetylase family protein [Rhizobium mongolense]SCW31756.1 Polysaccharide deacetylase [Rhizobium mongolense subsp. loessense]